MEGIKILEIMIIESICEGNTGALSFLMAAIRVDNGRAARAFRKMACNGITGSKLYMLWNDCCDRDTELALNAMERMSVEEIVRHINYDGGRGIPIKGMNE